MINPNVHRDEGHTSMRKPRSSIESYHRKTRQALFWSLWTGLCDILVIIISIIISHRIFQPDIAGPELGALCAAFSTIFVISGAVNGTYSIEGIQEPTVPAIRTMANTFFAALFVILIFFLTKVGASFSRPAFVFASVLIATLTPALKWFSSFVIRDIFGASGFREVVLIDGVEPKSDYECNYNSRIIDATEISRDNFETYQFLADALDGADSLVVYCTPEKRQKWAFILKALDVHSVINIPELSDLGPIELHPRAREIFVTINTGSLTVNQRFAKRIFDISFALFVSLILLPIALLISIFIKIESKGPILFSQERLGRGNRPFRIYKFRTMRVEATDAAANQLTIRDDPRVTKFGRLLRRTSLDEIPQFINVLLGDMSVVGPRPHARNARAGDALYWEVDSSYWHRHVVKPGITGLAQIRGFRGNTFTEGHLKSRLDADLNYVSQWSFMLDLEIILKTFSSLFHKNAF